MADPLVIAVFGAMAALPVLALAALRARRDAVMILTFFVVALFAINARYVVSGMGAVGTPALLVGAAAAWWWWMARGAPTMGLDREPNPVRVALLVYLWYVLLNWAIAHLRPLTELEASGSNRAIFTAITMTGIALLAVDGIDRRARFDQLVRRLVGVGVFLSSVGMVQFFTRFDPGSMLQLPGLTLNRDIAFVGTRSIFNRPFGTALHPIEFGVVLAMLVPLGVHLALHSPTERQRRGYTIATGVMAAGIPMSVSRSGVVAVIAAMLVLSAAWTWRQRLNGAVLAVGFTAVMWTLVPGLIGTLRALFLRADDDPSIIARIERFPLVAEQVSQAPWFGIGTGTFSPQEYFLLDNQYYGTTIETGFVGLAVVLALLVTALVCARWVRARAADAATGHLAQALAATMAVVVVVMATFDAFAFRIFTGTVFLLIGCIGALWRLVVRDQRVPEPAEPIALPMVPPPR